MALSRGDEMNVFFSTMSFEVVFYGLVNPSNLIPIESLCHLFLPPTAIERLTRRQ